jgi:hypothetical protein
MLHIDGLMVFLSVLLSVGAQTKDSPMTNQLLTLTVKCKGNDRCLYDGQDMPLEIHITNKQPVVVGFPLEYRQKTGPSIRLMDTRTKADAYLKTNLASFSLRDKFTQIPPGESVVLRWVITSGEIEQFVGNTVDISAEVSLGADVQVGEKRVDFVGEDKIHIVGKKKPKSS